MKKKCLVVGVVVLFIGMCVVPSTGTIIKEPYEQVSSGNTLYVGGDGPGNYSKIQDAIDDAVDGDTVFVYDDSSPYYENVVVDKRIILIGENKNTTIIDGNEGADTININSGNVNISGFTIKNGSAGIRIENLPSYDNNVIYNNIIYI